MKKNGSVSNRRILVVDDNIEIHKDFNKILNSDAHKNAMSEDEAFLFDDKPAEKHILPTFEIDSAYQGQEGFEMVQRALKENRPYPMAFMDMRMPPGWDGIETISKIWEVDPDLQIIICTAYSDHSLESMVEKLGYSDRFVILRKPFDVVEVHQLANAMTTKWELLQQTRRKIGDLEHSVTERSADLRKSQEHFRLIAENVSDLIALVDTDNKYLYSSLSFEKLLGTKSEELRGKSVLDAVHPEDRPRVSAALQASFQSSASQAFDYRILCKDGSWRTMESHTSPVCDPGGDTEHLVVVSRDSTERKTMEVQLRHAQKLESIGQLAAGIAHEINTPTQYIGDNTRFVQDSFRDLNQLLGANARLLAAAKLGTVQPELIAEVEAAAKAADVEYLSVEIPKAIQESLQGVDRVSKIVRAMKEFSHPGTGEKTSIDLNHAIESTLTVCASEWKYVAEVVTEFDASLPAVPCLPGEFNQVILNIVVNASHAIADVVPKGGKGKITLSTRRGDEWAEIRIRDTGGGIPEKARDRIFEPFFTTKGVGKGTGQGLAIARSVVVDKHGGTLTFETQAGVGTTFIIRLPLADNTVTEA